MLEPEEGHPAQDPHDEVDDPYRDRGDRGDQAGAKRLLRQIGPAKSTGDELIGSRPSSIVFLGLFARLCVLPP